MTQSDRSEPTYLAETVLGNDPERVIITAALTGATTSKEHHDGIPHTPKEIGAAAAKAAEAGAAQVHIHAKDQAGAPTFEDDTFIQIKEEIRNRCDAIINFSTGAFGVPIANRTSYLRAARPEVAALNMGTMNYAKFDATTDEFVFETVFENSFSDIQTFAQTMRDADIKPELECFDAGHVSNIQPLLSTGDLEHPLQFSLIFGVLGGIPATPAALIEQVRRLPDEATWQAIGVGRSQWNIITAAAAMGGNVRVGLEDNFYMPGGDRAMDNAELVSKAVDIVKNTGRRPATPKEARQILGLSSR